MLEVTNDLKERLNNYKEIPEERKAFHYIKQDQTELINNYLNNYVNELESVENFNAYFENNEIYNITFNVNYDVFKTGLTALNYEGAEILTGIGGPSLFIKLSINEGAAGINWGGEQHERKLKARTVEMLNDYFNDYFEYRVKMV